MEINSDIEAALQKVKREFPVEGRGEPTQLPISDAAYYEEAVERLPYWDMPDNILGDSKTVSAIVGMQPHAFLSYLPGLCQLVAEGGRCLAEFVSLLSIRRDVVREAKGVATLVDFLETIRDYSYLEWPREDERTWKEIDGIVEYLRENATSAK
jgi:hypothetical protein